MHRSSITKRDLECMLSDETSDPRPLPLLLLEEITDGFSDEQEIGRGGFAVVYKGKLENRTVAVKKMTVPYKYEQEFKREVKSLIMAKHKNVVRFLGYCADRQMIIEKYEGKLVMADVHQRLLCFEYLPKGSLHEYIADTSRKSRWSECYQIITGICEGLHYLHQKNIVHLDLKPKNILLDYNLVAKIADFGLSRCFIDETESRVISKIGGTRGYSAPESLIQNAQVTRRHSYHLDIYSLGVVIMEILTGEKQEYHVVENVVESWSNMLKKSQRNGQLEQVRVCAEIGIECTNCNPAERPDIQHIINRLDGTKNMDAYIKNGVTTSRQEKHTPQELHKSIPDSLGETSSKENVIDVTVVGEKPCNSIWENTVNIDKLNETMHSLNPDIRQCLEFCSIFPRGFKLRRDELARLWIAQGFVKTRCVTTDMEDTAGEYIQELLSCSFLQPVGTSSYNDCFTIHDVMHDILDKVAGNCFRIENERSHRGEGWEEHVPQHIQHLFIQNYDGELIAETIIGLEYLRTLIVYVVGNDTPIEEKLIESICERLPNLRVLAIAFSQEHDQINQPSEFSVPESVGQLKNLRYLAIRTHNSCMITLPSTLSNLQHIQLLDFGDGDISEFTFAKLVNLRHILCSKHVKLPYVGMLISLQTLPCFNVSNEQGHELNQLRELNKLRGKLRIRGLENVETKEQALEANLVAKRLTQLTLGWDYDDDTGCSPEVQANVFEGMCPPMGLQILLLYNFLGLRYPDWMVAKDKGGPKYLQELHIVRCSQPGPDCGLVEAFPHLRVLNLNDCRWDALPGNMEHLTSLKKLQITYCWNIRSLPSLPQSLEKFTLGGCNNEFSKSCQTVGRTNWQKIEHIPDKEFW